MTKLKKQLHDRKTFFVYGGTDTSEREKIRGVVENEKNAIILAS